MEGVNREESEAEVTLGGIIWYSGKMFWEVKFLVHYFLTIQDVCILDASICGSLGLRKRVRTPGGWQDLEVCVPTPRRPAMMYFVSLGTFCFF